MGSWMREPGLAMSLTELGATEDVLEDIVNRTLIPDGGYKMLTKEDIREILRQSLQQPDSEKGRKPVRRKRIFLPLFRILSIEYKIWKTKIQEESDK